MVPQISYVVVPFEREGFRVGPRQALIVDGVSKARTLAQHLSRQVPGVAVLERQLDPETGDGSDRLVVGYGAVPPHFPDDTNWTLDLH